jgi:hypothetical protein
MAENPDNAFQMAVPFNIGVVQDAARFPRIIASRASVLDCGGPPPLFPAAGHPVADASQNHDANVQANPAGIFVIHPLRVTTTIYEDAR